MFNYVHVISVRVAEGISKVKVDQIKDEIKDKIDNSALGDEFHPEKRNVRSRSLPKRFQTTEDISRQSSQIKTKNEVKLFLILNFYLIFHF